METISNAIYALLLAGAVYGGIRADLRHLRESILRHQSILDKLTDRMGQLCRTCHQPKD